MTEREAKIIHTAIRLFSQYGVKRVTMNELAGEAGIARQTLYNAYTNKEEVLYACLWYHTQNALETIKKGLPHCNRLTDVLELLLKEISIKPYQLLAKAAHADEIVDGYQSLPQEKRATMEEAYIQQIALALSPFEEQLKNKAYTLESLAEIIFLTAHAAKKNARDETHLLQLLNVLKALVNNTP